MASQAPYLFRLARLPRCPPHLRQHLKRLVNGSPASWLSPPIIGEVSETLIEAERRLRGFLLAEGFDVVRTSGDSQRVPGSTFQYIYDSIKTVNKRNLKKRVIRNSENEVISKSERERESTAARYIV